MTVIRWDPAYQQAWYDLCYEWLDQYDLIEEEDLRIMRDPEGVILAPGGQILLAVEDGVLLGTLSLIPEGEGVFELAKMGVAPAHRRRGVADALLARAHSWAWEQGARKLILFTNRKLEAAQYLYAKWGFAEICAPDEKFLLSDKQMEKRLDPPAFAVMETPLGLLRLEETCGAITAIHLPAPDASLIAPETPLLQEACRQMHAYFTGQLRHFSLPFRLDGCSPFQRRVLETLYRKVPYGSTVSYGELAALAGNPRAARAVGSVMRRNPLCILIPCHRVLPADGSIGAYSAAQGAESKVWLLTQEGAFFNR